VLRGGGGVSNFCSPLLTWMTAGTPTIFLAHAHALSHACSLSLCRSSTRKLWRSTTPSTTRRNVHKQRRALTLSCSHAFKLSSCLINWMGHARSAIRVLQQYRTMIHSTHVEDVMSLLRFHSVVRMDYVYLENYAEMLMGLFVFARACAFTFTCACGWVGG